MLQQPDLSRKRSLRRIQALRRLPKMKHFRQCNKSSGVDPTELKYISDGDDKVNRDGPGEATVAVLSYLVVVGEIKPLVLQPLPVLA